MTTKMVVYLLNGNAKVFDFRTDYTDIKIAEGILYIYRNTDVRVIYAKGFWRNVEFNRDEDYE
jgi:hypothetical protein